MAQMVGFKGVEQSSPTLSSAMSNLTPAFTFTLAVIFRFHSTSWFLTITIIIVYVTLNWFYFLAWLVKDGTSCVKELCDSG